MAKFILYSPEYTRIKSEQWGVLFACLFCFNRDKGQQTLGIKNCEVSCTIRRNYTHIIWNHTQAENNHMEQIRESYAIFTSVGAPALPCTKLHQHETCKQNQLHVAEAVLHVTVANDSTWHLPVWPTLPIPIWVPRRSFFHWRATDNETRRKKEGWRMASAISQWTQGYKDFEWFNTSCLRDFESTPNSGVSGNTRKPICVFRHKTAPCTAVNLELSLKAPSYQSSLRISSQLDDYYFYLMGQLGSLKKTLL